MEKYCFNSEIIWNELISLLRHSGPSKPDWKKLNSLTGATTLSSKIR